MKMMLQLLFPLLLLTTRVTVEAASDDGDSVPPPLQRRRRRLRGLLLQQQAEATTALLGRSSDHQSTTTTRELKTISMVSKRGKDLDRCEGDCDTDDDCMGNYVCFQREKDEYKDVPGCLGGTHDASRTDYCIDPSTTTSDNANDLLVGVDLDEEEDGGGGGNDDHDGDDGDVGEEGGVDPPVDVSSTRTTWPTTPAPFSSSSAPSDYPSLMPSSIPSAMSSDMPSLMASGILSAMPSDMPSLMPSDILSAMPSDVPSLMPFGILSAMPSDMPSLMPSGAPSSSAVVATAADAEASPLVDNDDSPPPPSSCDTSQGDKDVGVFAYFDETCVDGSHPEFGRLGCFNDGHGNRLPCRHCQAFSTDKSDHLVECPEYVVLDYDPDNTTPSSSSSSSSSTDCETSQGDQDWGISGYYDPTCMDGNHPNGRLGCFNENICRHCKSFTSNRSAHLVACPPE